MPGRRCCVPLPPPPLVGPGRAFADTSPGTGGGEDREISAAGLSCFSTATAATALLWSLPALSRWRTTAMGIMWERHWLDALPVCTAAHLVLLSCGHLWWWRRGWGGEAKAATLVRSQTLNSKQYVNTTGRLPLTTQSSPSLAYSPALKRIHFHFNCICQCLWCRTCSSRRKNNLLTEGCTACELIDGRLGHAVSQHTGELQEEKQGIKVQQQHRLLKKTPKSQRPDA